ncbi:MAG: ParB/RepB/Spo0J family partition protein [Planctomycetes bacterium]|nr:ParB/RepB/Spo0J family partition protein [Planctomycetota bacterium]
MDSIVPNRFQPRREFAAEAIESLSSSIRQNGLLQPLVVRRVPSGFELIAGERRLRALKALGHRMASVVVREASDDQMLQLALIENMQRTDLNAIEKAHAFRDMAQRFGLSQEDIAGRTGLDRTTVTNFLRLLDLQREIQEMVSRGTLSMGHARALLSVVSSEERLRLAHRVISESLSVRKVENIISRLTQQAKEQRSPTKRDAYLISVEDRLRKALGVRVQILPRRRGGSIVIDYANADDLNRILSRIQTD